MMRHVIIVLTSILIGCAGLQPVIPSSSLTGTDSGPDQVPQYLTVIDSALVWDFENGTVEIVPDRDPDMYFDVWDFLLATGGIQMQILDHDTTNHILTVNVQITNPTNLSVYFLRTMLVPAIGKNLDLIDPDGWWHAADMPFNKEPVPFMAYAKSVPDLEFAGHFTDSATFTIQYSDLSDFAGSRIRAICRYPLEPGEVMGIQLNSEQNNLTRLGGFYTLWAELDLDGLDESQVSPTIVFVVDNSVISESILRATPEGEYIGAFPGVETTSYEAQVWIKASMAGIADYSACRIDVPIADVTPTPSREFPPVGDGISVFVDQLAYGMTEAQKEFMATHCVGSQKLVKVLADSMRVYNEDFIVVQYHLAFGEGDISNIVGNDWISNWAFTGAQEDYYEHRSWSTQPNYRVLQQDWDWYLTDPTSDWVLYFIANTLYRMAPLGDQFDGVFADSASQPWNTDPSKWWEGSDDPHDMFTYWTPKTQYFFDTVAHAYHTCPIFYYLIPNAGSYVTTISDITYFQCDGVMIEGFCHWGPDSYFTEVDWRLQMNRMKALASEDKIILCQTGVDVENTTDRAFVLGTYMLLKDDYTYLNILGPWGLEPQWWPEYSFNIGAAIDNWADVSELQDTGGCYVRNFENGIVIVNPSDETRFFTTTKSYSHTMFGSGGLLPDDGIPTGVATGPIEEAGPKELPPHSTWLGAG